MTEDNKNWPLLLCLPSQNDNNAGTDSPSLSKVYRGIEQPQPQHLKIVLCLGIDCYLVV